MAAIVAALILMLSDKAVAVHAAAAPQLYGYRVVHTYPHDARAFTEGLFYHRGYLYESTGMKGQSVVRKVKLETGEVVLETPLPPEYFGEGIVNWNNELVQLTWQGGTGFVYDVHTFLRLRQFHYVGEGWALTQNGRAILMDDGTAQIRFWNPDTLRETHRITVTDGGQPVSQLNELEWVKGEIYANVWHTNRIARIDAASGRVLAWIDLAGLINPSELDGDGDSVLNGIAYDAVHDRLFVTGKRWPKLFEIRLVRK